MTKSFKWTEAAFLALLENSYDLIHLLNESNIVIYASPSLKRVLGYEQEEFVGKDAAGFMHPEDIAGLLKPLTEIYSTPGHGVQMEFRIKHKDGHWVDIEVTARNLLHLPEISAIVVNSRDISDRKRRERELALQNAELERLAKLLSGRENAMIKLKKENVELRRELDV